MRRTITLALDPDEFQSLSAAIRKRHREYRDMTDKIIANGSTADALADEAARCNQLVNVVHLAWQRGTDA